MKDQAFRFSFELVEAAPVSEASHDLIPVGRAYAINLYGSAPYAARPYEQKCKEVLFDLRSPPHIRQPIPHNQIEVSYGSDSGQRLALARRWHSDQTGKLVCLWESAGSFLAAPPVRE